MDNLSPERVREFVIAGHGDLAKVQAMLAETPELLSAAHEWKPGDTETAIQGASHVGNAAIAEHLLAQGAPLAIYTAAMLGRVQEVRGMLEEDPSLAQEKGAHGIPLLPHAAFAGNVELMESLAEAGATEGSSMALGFAAGRGHIQVVRWLLENLELNLSWQNFQSKTPLQLATEGGHTAVAELLQQYAHGKPA
ncbi:MAG: ankyrin repeat domain-containing protein [Meiothermus sp.]